MKQKSVLEKNPIKTILIIIFTGLLIIDVVAANLYKLYFGHVFHDRRQHQFQRIEKTYRIKSDIYHHDLAKNVYVKNAIWGDREYAIATDSLGFKTDRSKDTPMISENYRIIFIGDSFTEGIGLPYSETFVGRIAGMLSEKNIEVLNAAVSSYSPTIYYKKIKYLLEIGLKFNELVVFIDISDISDEAINYKMPPDAALKIRQPATHETLENYEKLGDPKTLETDKEPGTNERSNALEMSTGGLREMIKNNTMMTHFILRRVEDYVYNALNRDTRAIKITATNLPASMWTIDENNYKEYGDDGLKIAEFAMNQLYKLLKKNQLRLTIAVYPWPDQIVNHDLDSIQVKFWRKWAREKQVGFLNYFPCFIEESSGHRCISFSTLKKYFIAGDVHWNETGHQLIADEFMSFYSSKDCHCAESHHWKL